MRKETNLTRVKMIAHVLLDMPIAQTSFSPTIVSHPFTSTGVTAVPIENGSFSVVDLLDNAEDRVKWREMMDEQIMESPEPEIEIQMRWIFSTICSRLSLWVVVLVVFTELEVTKMKNKMDQEYSFSSLVLHERKYLRTKYIILYRLLALESVRTGHYPEKRL